MLFFKKKQKQEKNDKEYSIQEILSITKSAKDENERQMKKAQSEYYKKIDAKILRAAKRGENRIVAISHDGLIILLHQIFLKKLLKFIMQRDIKQRLCNLLMMNNIVNG